MGMAGLLIFLASSVINLLTLFFTSYTDFTNMPEHKNNLNRSITLLGFSPTIRPRVTDIRGRKCG